MFYFLFEYQSDLLKKCLREREKKRGEMREKNM